MRQNIQLSILFLFGFLCAVPFNLQAQATIVVNSEDDAGVGTLRAAVATAASGDTIVFSEDVFFFDLLTGAIVIDQSLTIIGNGEDDTVISSLLSSTSAFIISGDIDVTIRNLSIEDGESATSGGGISVTGATLMLDSVMISNCTALGAMATQGGGAIVNSGGDVTIMNTRLVANSAMGMSGSGGAVLNLDGGTLIVIDSDITGNFSNRAGGGIEDNSGADGLVTLTNVNLSFNETGLAPGNGGGLHVTGAGNVDINGGTVNSNNASAEGGGLWNGSGTMNIFGTTIQGNAAAGDGADQGGGGIYNLSGTVAISGDAVISDNMATGTAGSGGGILNDAGADLTVLDATISGNSSIRAGGGIEDNSGMEGFVTLTNVSLTANTTGGSPGNGGGFHITGPGSANITGGSVSDNTATAEGGGLWNGGGTMTIVDVTIENNSAAGNDADQGGGGVYNLSGTVAISGNTMINGNMATGTSGSGGGILNDVGAMLTIDGATISGNSSVRAGGGIEDVSGEATTIALTDVMLNGNTTGGAPGNGGGLHITGSGNADITGGTVNNNTATAEGGGLWNGSGTMTVVGVAVNGNTANGDAADQGGGGIYNLSGTVAISGNTMITGNMATGMAGSGGGVLNDVGGTLTINGATVSENTSIRAGGGIEDVSGDATTVMLTNVMLNSNTTGGAPGNGGGLHITGNGNVQVTGGTVNNNTAAAEGGGLWNGAGTMTVADVTIDGNSAAGDAADQGGGGIYNLSGTVAVTGTTTIINNSATGAAGSGGGILNDVGGTLNATSITISGNSSVRAGGGIEDVSGETSTVNLVDVRLMSNTTGGAPGNGGGLHITGAGNVNMTGGVVNDNTATAEGGGLWNGSGLMTLNEVSVTNNTATGGSADQGGGGVFNAGGTIDITASTIAANIVDGAGTGGGINNDADGTVNITSSTISGNISAQTGGGVANNGTLNVTSTTIAENMADLEGGGIFQSSAMVAAILTGTLVANNTTGTSGVDVAGMNTVSSDGFNLIGIDDTGAFSAMATDTVGTETAPVDPILDILADNGGPTMTHALLCPSPAINMGNPDNNDPDQRGMMVFEGRRDIGAFEIQEICISFVEDEILLAGSKLYPNPAGGEFVWLEIPENFGDDVLLRLSVIGTGQQLREQKITFMGTHRLDLRGLPSGLYQVQLFAKGAVISHKLVVKK